MGWAVDHVERLAGMILCNTGIAVPEGRSAPGDHPVRRLAPACSNSCATGRRRSSRGRSGCRAIGCRRPIARRSGRRTRRRRREWRSPTSSATSRSIRAIRPNGPSPRSPIGSARSPSRCCWRGGRATRCSTTTSPPTSRRGCRTPCCTASPNANHLVMAEAVAGEPSVADVADHFMSAVIANPNPNLNPTTDVCVRISDAMAPEILTQTWIWRGDCAAGVLGAGVRERAGDDAVAFVDMATGDELRFAELAQRIDAIAADLLRRGLRAGAIGWPCSRRRASTSSPPSTACGAPAGSRSSPIVGSACAASVRRSRARGPRWVIGPRRALLAATRHCAGPRGRPPSTSTELVGAQAPVGTSSLPAEPAADDVAAILFTSGATGPAKGVRYRHRQLAAQRDALGPHLRDHGRRSPRGGLRTVRAVRPGARHPDLPAGLRRHEAGGADGRDARRRLRRASVRPWRSDRRRRSPTWWRPRAERATWPGLAGLRIVFSAGAPVPPETLHAVADLAPSASLHTPYGMTEALPVTDIDLAGDRRRHARRPRRRRLRRAAGRRVRRRVQDRPPPAPARSSSTAPWVSDGYLDLWDTQHRARPFDGEAVWHRSGDVGHLDDAGRLWVEGRTVHVIHSESRPDHARPRRACGRARARCRSLGGGRHRSGRRPAAGRGARGPRRRIRAWRAPPRPTRSDA